MTEPPQPPPVRHRVQQAAALADYLTRRFPDLARGTWHRLAVEGRFTVAGRELRPHDRLEPGDTLEATLPAALLVSDDPPPDLPVLFHDDHLVAVDKAAGLLCYPLGLRTLTAKAYAERHVFVRDGAPALVRPAHRLDAKTSGVLLFAKTLEADRGIKARFAAREVDKTYRAVVHGSLLRQEQRIDAPIGPDRDHPNRVRMRVDPAGRSAVTLVRGLGPIGDDFGAVEARPLTGRSHQIRVHLAHLGHPIRGDALYSADPDAPRHALHAAELAFVHPITAARVVIQAPIPEGLGPT